MSNRIKVQRGVLTVSPWPQGDATLKKLLDLKYTRARIAEELTHELRIRVTDDQVTSRGKRRGWIVTKTIPNVPKSLTPITPQRLSAIIAARLPVARAKTCQNPMWFDKYTAPGELDPAYGHFCGKPCAGHSSYCEEHRSINIASQVNSRNIEAFNARGVTMQLDRIAIKTEPRVSFMPSRLEKFL